MGRLRTIIYGSFVGAVLGVVLAPRRGESRRVAVDRLRLAARSGRGARTAFSGTPCSLIARVDDEAVVVPANPESQTEGALDEG